MPKYIVKLGEYYLEWSTIVDSPITFGMPLDEFKIYYQDEYGRDGFRDLETRLERVEAKGISALYESLEDVLRLNRAGPNETELTQEEIYIAYCIRHPIKDGWVVPTYEKDLP